MAAIAGGDWSILYATRWMSSSVILPDEYSRNDARTEILALNREWYLRLYGLRTTKLLLYRK